MYTRASNTISALRSAAVQHVRCRQLSSKESHIPVSEVSAAKLVPKVPESEFSIKKLCPAHPTDEHMIV